MLLAGYFGMVEEPAREAVAEWTGKGLGSMGVEGIDILSGKRCIGDKMSGLLKELPYEGRDELGAPCAECGVPIDEGGGRGLGSVMDVEVPEKGLGLVIDPEKGEL